MEIVESWEDHNDNVYAIVRYSKEDQQKYPAIKKYEALWLDNENDELCSFAGSVGYRIAVFDTIEEAQDFLLKGISNEDTNTDIWFQMLEVR